MKAKFWGTRGSIAKAGPETVRYGGNTSCVEVRSETGTLVVLDCGTGAHALGQALVRDGSAARAGHILISHTHWDHIQGPPLRHGGGLTGASRRATRKFAANYLAMLKLAAIRLWLRVTEFTT